MVKTRFKGFLPIWLIALLIPSLLPQPCSAGQTQQDSDLRRDSLVDAPAIAKRALIIGVGSYESASPLPVTTDDARHFASLLQTRFGFPKEAITLMTDDPTTPDNLKPTYTQLSAALQTLLAGLNARSEVVIFFSGHGIHLNNRDWLLPLDGDPTDVESSCIDYDQIKQALDTQRPRRALLIVDACRNLYGGKGAESSGFGVSKEQYGPQLAEMVSCLPTEVSHDGKPADFMEGAFTHYLIQGLSGDKEALAPGTGGVTFDSLKLYVREKVRQYVSSRYRETQIPDGHATLGAMVLTKEEASAPAKAVVKAPVKAEPGTAAKTEASSVVKADPGSAVKAEAKSPAKGDASIPMKGDARSPVKAEAGTAVKAGVSAPVKAEVKSPAVLVREGREAEDRKDYATALTLYRQAADLGDPRGMNHLGVMYGAGRGVTRDDVEAVKWFRKAVAAGNSSSQFNLGAMTLEGRGVTRNDVEAVKWFRKAAVAGDPKGMNSLGVAYEKGQGVAQNYNAAVQWFRKAAEAGDPSGMSNFGVMILKGHGVTRNYTAAVNWFRKAAEAGDASGMDKLGVAYENGQGVPKDYTEAVKWYRKAAEAGEAAGMSDLGWMYEHGYGVTQDIEEAVNWYRKAADAGNEDARAALKRLGR